MGMYSSNYTQNTIYGIPEGCNNAFTAYISSPNSKGPYRNIMLIEHSGNRIFFNFQNNDQNPQWVGWSKMITEKIK